eukprot:3165437-Alexandrium_andersonii.AAC.1
MFALHVRACVFTSRAFARKATAEATRTAQVGECLRAQTRKSHRHGTRAQAQVAPGRIRKSARAGHARA